MCKFASRGNENTKSHGQNSRQI